MKIKNLLFMAAATVCSPLGDNVQAEESTQEIGACYKVAFEPFDLKTEAAKRGAIAEINNRLISSACIDGSRLHFQGQPQIDLYNIEALLYGDFGEWDKVLEIREQERKLYPRLAGMATIEIIFADLAQTPPRIKQAYSELPVAQEAARRESLVPYNDLLLLKKYQPIYAKVGEKPLQLFFGAMTKGKPAESPELVSYGIFRDSAGVIDLNTFNVSNRKPLEQLLTTFPKSALCEGGISP